MSIPHRTLKNRQRTEREGWHEFLSLRVHRVLSWDEVAAEKLGSAWREGFADNHDSEVLDTVEPQLEQFVRMFTTAVEGDMFAMEYIPGQGTRVSINGDAARTVGTTLSSTPCSASFSVPNRPTKISRRVCLQSCPRPFRNRKLEP